ncbi:hypothetical protein LZ190_27200, partial [Rhodovulum sulfidophilum]|nr:hypothetical protein [Rhodovulum sulfidophilum]
VSNTVVGARLPEEQSEVPRRAQDLISRPSVLCHWSTENAEAAAWPSFQARPFRRSGHEGMTATGPKEA